ncbi:MAG: sigma-70 family RNA polymerase sigma factor [Anaerolineae bacterium]|jgi:RNA polymerase sigma-70 factor (ECF subfamily)|nr:sigma-70 family RNA polymerase sigma factor [Anaerolineae bacterium]
MDWNAIYTDALPRVYNYFRYRVGAGPLAEDLTAATFEKAWRGRLRYRRDLGAFTTWLFTIAHNVAVDHFRRHDPALSLEESPPGAATAPSAEALAQRRADFARLSALLAQLPEREQELIALKYGADLTNRHIAAITGLTESNVGVILHRAIGKLREQWENKP